MKKILSALLIMLTFMANVISVDAYTYKETGSDTISTSACDGEVYTNYYLLLEANTRDFFDTSQNSNLYTTNKAVYTNNSYLVDYFDEDNIGYGQVEINRTTKTKTKSSSYNYLMTSMSLSDYYSRYLGAMQNSYNGVYTSGNNRYFVMHSWFEPDAYGNWQYAGTGLDFSNFSRTQLTNATINANATIARESGNITNNSYTEFSLEVSRSYYNTSLTGSPIYYNGHQWYLNPQVYYVQYCEDDNYYDDDYDNDYNLIRYRANGDNVENLPNNQRKSATCAYVTDEEPIRDGYKFLYWNTESDDTGDTYYPGRQLCDSRDRDITLYAIWERDYSSNTSNNNNSSYTYTITYNSNTTDSVTNMPSNVTVNSNENAYISSLTPVRYGYEFLGWSTNSNASSPEYNSGSLYSNRSNITLYAIWTKVGNAVTLPENPKTGIMDYLLPLGGTAGASGAGLALLKRKRSFKQF